MKSGVFHDLFPKLSAIFKRPEVGSVVKALLVVNVAKAVGVGDDIGKRLLPNVVHADAQHEEIQPLFEHPVDLFLPIFIRPMLRLKAVKSAVGKIAQTAVFKVRLFGNIDVFERNVGAFRYYIAVPKIMTADEALEIIVHRIDRRAPSAACGDEDPSFALLIRIQAVIVGPVTDAERRKIPRKHFLRRKIVHAVRADDDKIAPAVVDLRQGGAFSRYFTIKLGKDVRRTIIRLFARARFQYEKRHENPPYSLTVFPVEMLS